MAKRQGSMDPRHTTTEARHRLADRICGPTRRGAMRGVGRVVGRDVAETRDCGLAESISSWIRSYHDTPKPRPNAFTIATWSVGSSQLAVVSWQLAVGFTDDCRLLTANCQLSHGGTPIGVRDGAVVAKRDGGAVADPLRCGGDPELPNPFGLSRGPHGMPQR